MSGAAGLYEGNYFERPDQIIKIIQDSGLRGRGGEVSYWFKMVIYAKKQ